MVLKGLLLMLGRLAQALLPHTLLALLLLLLLLQGLMIIQGQGAHGSLHLMHSRAGKTAWEGQGRGLISLHRESNAMQKRFLWTRWKNNESETG